MDVGGGGPAAVVGGGGGGGAPVPVPAAGGAPGENPLAFLRDHEMFQQIRSVIQQNPQMLTTMLQQIGRSNPELLSIISQNQEAFIRMINEGETGDDLDLGSLAGTGEGMPG